MIYDFLTQLREKVIYSRGMEALERLKEGNARFVANDSHHPRQCSTFRQMQIEKQNPFAAILACSDSRVPVEILFDQGIGDLFVVRLAGNVATESAIDSLRFAIDNLNVSHIVVLGHQNCGAVIAKKGDEPIKEAVMANLQEQLEIVTTAFENVDVRGAYYDFETGNVTFL